MKKIAAVEKVSQMQVVTIINRLLLLIGSLVFLSLLPSCRQDKSNNSMLQNLSSNSDNESYTWQDLSYGISVKTSPDFKLKKIIFNGSELTPQDNFLKTGKKRIFEFNTSQGRNNLKTDLKTFSQIVMCEDFISEISLLEFYFDTSQHPSFKFLGKKEHIVKVNIEGYNNDIIDVFQNSVLKLLEPTTSTNQYEVSGKTSLYDLFEELRNSQIPKVLQEDISNINEANLIPPSCRERFDLLKVISNENLKGFESGSYQLVNEMEVTLNALGIALSKIIPETLNSQEVDLEELIIKVIGYTDNDRFIEKIPIPNKDKEFYYSQAYCPSDVASEPYFIRLQEFNVSDLYYINARTGIGDNCQLSAARAHEAIQLLGDSTNVKNVILLYAAGGIYSDQTAKQNSRRIEVFIEYTGAEE